MKRGRKKLEEGEKSVPKNRQIEIKKDLLKKKTENLWMDYQLIEYLMCTYGYTYSTSQRYVELLWQDLKANVSTDYEKNLVETIAILTIQIQNETNPFLRFMMIKELNKIKGLGQTQKIDVNHTINQIQTIRINSNKPAQSLPEKNNILDAPHNDNNLLSDINENETNEQ